MSRRTTLNIAFFAVVFVVMLGWAASNIISVDQLDNPYKINAEFPVAAGVQPNAEVAYLGVHYGRVSSVERTTEPAGVRMTLKMEQGKYLPKGAIARVFRKSAIGEPYIDFIPPDTFTGTVVSKAAAIQPGETVPMSDTRIPLEFSELLKAASAVLAAVNPKKAEIFVHELAVALDGRGDALRSLTVDLEKLNKTFAAKDAELDRLAVNNTAITKVVADHASDLGESITNLRLLADTLQASTGDAATLLDKGTQLVGLLADVVADQKGNLDCTLKDLTDLTDLTVSKLAGTDYLLTHGPTDFGLVWATRDVLPDGVWARVNLLTDPNNPAPQYVPPLSVPAVPAVPACTSTVSASHGVDFVPSQELAAARTTNTTMPATGGVALLGLIGGLAGAALALRWISRGRRA